MLERPGDRLARSGHGGDGVGGAATADAFTRLLRAAQRLAATRR